MGAKVAYIDYKLKETGLFVKNLEMRGIEVASSSSLGFFSRKYNLKDFKVLLYHPGVKHQQELKEISDDNPHLAVAGVCSSPDDYTKSDMPVYGYGSIDAILEFVLDNQ